MNQTKYRIARLDDTHESCTFSCGSTHLDDYLKKRAEQDLKKNISVPYVLAKHSSNKVMGYYTISSVGIDVTLFPKEFVKKLPKYAILPGVLLGRLAVDSHHHRKGIGGFLLIDALKKSVLISKKIGISAVIVEAKDKNALDFYTHFGFVGLPDHKFRLFLPTNTLRKLSFDF